jgi:hypothetical protein
MRNLWSKYQVSPSFQGLKIAAKAKTSLVLISFGPKEEKKSARLHYFAQHLYIFPFISSSIMENLSVSIKGKLEDGGWRFSQLPVSDGAIMWETVAVLDLAVTHSARPIKTLVV